MSLNSALYSTTTSFDDCLHHLLVSYLFLIMASSSKQKFSEPEAQKMADDWEARIRRLVNDDDQEAFKNDQPVLYEKLVSPSFNFN